MNEKNHSCMRIWISVSTVVHAVGTAEKGPAELGSKSEMGFVFCVATQGRDSSLHVSGTAMFSVMTLTQLYHDVHYLLKR